MSSSVHINNEGKDMLIHGRGPTEELNHNLAAEIRYSINFTRPGIKFCFSLHFNDGNSFLFVNTTKIYQFKAKDSEMKDHTLCLDHISKHFTIKNMKTGLKWTEKVFSVNYNAIDANDILDIHMYLMKKTLIGLSADLVNRSNHTKWALLCNQKCMIDLLLLIYILMKTIKNFISIHLGLN